MQLYGRKQKLCYRRVVDVKTTVDLFTELVIESNKPCDASQARTDPSTDLLTELAIEQNKPYRTR